MNALRPDNLNNLFRIVGTVSLPDLAIMHGWVPAQAVQECRNEIQDNPVKPPLETLLVARQLLTPSQLSTLLMEQAELGTTLGERTGSTFRRVNPLGDKKGETPSDAAIRVGPPSKMGGRIGVGVVLAGIAIWVLLGNMSRTADQRLVIEDARAAVARHDWLKAREILDRLETNPEAGALRATVIAELDKARDNQVRTFEAAAAVDRVLEELNSLEASPERIEKMLADAEKTAIQAAADSPELAGAHFQKARCDALRWRFDEGRRSFAEAIKRDEALDSAHLEKAMMAVVELVMTERPEITASMWKEWRRELIGREGETLKKLAARRPELTARARLQLEIIEPVLKVEAGPEAVDLLQKAYLKHRDPAILIWLGVLRLKAGETESAKSALELGVEDRPYSLVGRLGLAQALEASGKLDEALEQWALAARTDAKNPHVVLGWASCLEKKGRYDDAIQKLVGCTHPSTRLIRARALRQMGKPGDAVQECSALLVEQPSAAWVRVERARARAALGRYPDAVSDLQAAGEKDPEVKARVAVLLEEYKSQK